jgi:hypothetical protein
VAREVVMKQYLIPILAVLALALVTAIGCTPDLPKETEETFYTTAYQAGYSWGYQLTAENKDRKDLFWTPPDKVDVAQEVNPQINIQDYYIPKGYWTTKDVANAQFPDGAPFNEMQKKQAIEANNWGFYDGFLQGVDDYLKGKGYRFGP